MDVRSHAQNSPLKASPSNKGSVSPKESGVPEGVQDDFTLLNFYSSILC